MQTKACFKCGKTLPLEDFYVHPQMGDGHLNKCKACTKTDVRKRYYDKHEDVMAYECKRLDDPARREKQRGYSRKKRGTPSQMAATERYDAANPHKKRAHGIVARAIESGLLVRQPCEVCGDPNTHGHHDDYSKPLAVSWLCPKHHGERHRTSEHRRHGEQAA
jgi:hypothetical protein